MTTSVAIHGAGGRMGKRLVTLASEDADLQLVAALEHAKHPQIGEDAGQIAGVGFIDVPLASTLGDAHPAVVVDFSLPAATSGLLEMCRQANVGLVIGTTGHSDDDEAAIDQTAKSIPILQAPNMSLGVNLLFALAAQVAARLGDDYDIEIVEAHHRFKKDAPSGTALGIAKAICEATDKNPDKVIQHGRSGEDLRQPGQIGMHALRLGDEIGRHTVCFGGLGEELQISHKANTRDVFVRGALSAAKWLAGKQPGRYAMKDVLGL